MGITINDLRRAILADGDISVFAAVYAHALGGAPVPVTSRWNVPLRLPEPNVLADYPDAVFSNQLSRQGRSNATLTDGQLDLTLVVVAPNGKNSGTHLERVIEETRPDVIALDVSPIGLSADILYAFSLYNALGIPTCAEIRHRDSGQLYLTREFYPGGMTESAIIRSWLGKIPLVPVGQRSKRTMNLEELESAVWESELTAAQTTLDEELENTLNLETSNLITARIGDSLLKSLSGEQRESLSNEACYIASRIIDIAASTPGRKVRILAIVDLPHYPDIEELRKGLEPGVAAEIYVPQRAEVKPAEMTMIRSDRDASVEVNQRPISEPNPAQRLFVNQFNDFIQTRDNEVLALTEARRLVTEITSRIRPHPGVRLGVSVRGTLAFETVSCGLAELGNGLTRECLRKAALITIPPRITTAEGYDKAGIVSDITQEVLYDIRFAGAPTETTDLSLSGLSAEEILKKLAEMGQEQQAERTTAQKGPPTVMPQQSQDLSKRLESANYKQKSHPRQRSFSDRALDYLLKQLENKLQMGGMTAAEFKQEKDRLLSQFRDAAGDPQFFSSGSEMASTIMEMIDAQDKQWNPEVSFDTMHIYYHIKASSDGAELSPAKQDYHALKWLMDDLERQGVLRTAGNSSGFLLTGLSLDILLKYLTGKDETSRNVGLREAGRTQSWERSHETRRYRSGDPFRDISIRHTLKELSRQKKTLSDVRARDIRVNLKQLHRAQSDIVLCIDTSGSMGFHQNLMYARLAATGLVQASLAAGDRVGLVSFDDCGQVTMPPMGEGNRDTLLNCIAALSPRGNTNIGDGIKTAKESLFRDHSRNRKRIILITDGQPNVISEKAFNRLKLLRERDLTEESTLAETKLAKAMGVQVSVVHIATSGEASDAFVRKIVRIGNGRVRRITGPEDLKSSRVAGL